MRRQLAKLLKCLFGGALAHCMLQDPTRCRFFQWMDGIDASMSSAAAGAADNYGDRSFSGGGGGGGGTSGQCFTCGQTGCVEVVKCSSCL